MRILVSGSSGLVGAALVGRLREEGHDVAALVRQDTPAAQRGPEGPASHRAVLWNPATGLLDSSAEGADAVVHLAGASIADGRWTAARKQTLRDSRVPATRKLVAALSRLRRPPKVFVAASAIGYYGNRGEEELSESSAPGTEFLAQLARDWETESSRAAELGARVVILRFGIILAKQGGALPQMLLPFRLGIGGRLGGGQQWMSWVALADVLGMLQYALGTNLVSGAVNAVAPRPVRNTEFTQALAHVLHRPAILPAPAFALRLALGEMADALLLASIRVVPSKLQQLGYTFAQPELMPALASILA